MAVVEPLGSGRTELRIRESILRLGGHAWAITVYQRLRALPLRARACASGALGGLRGAAPSGSFIRVTNPNPYAQAWFAGQRS